MAGPPCHDWGRKVWMALHRVKETMTLPDRRSGSIYGVILAGFRILAQFADLAIVTAMRLNTDRLLLTQFHKTLHNKSSCCNAGQNGKCLCNHWVSSPEELKYRQIAARIQQVRPEMSHPLSHQVSPHSNVIPAKAGTHANQQHISELWTSAFAGVRVLRKRRTFCALSSCLRRHDGVAYTPPAILTAQGCGAAE